MSPVAWLVVAGVVGACVGSFLNVVVWRLPRGESLVRPPSRCPGCGKHIRWHDNVPVLGWLWLGGRCRDCRTPISLRYPLVEAATALLFVWVAASKFPLPGEPVLFGATAALLAALLTISLIDADTRLVPRAITTPGIVLGLALSLLEPGLHPGAFPAISNRHVASLLEALGGMAAGAGVVIALRFVWWAAFRREGMGFGDVKILALIGTFLSPLRSLLVLLLGSLVGVVLGSFLRVTVGSRFRRTRGRVGGARILAAKATAAVPKRRLFSGPKPARVVAIVSGEPPACGTTAKLDWTVPVDDAFVERPLRLRLDAKVVAVAPRGKRRRVALDLPPLTDEQDDAVWGFHAARVAIPFGPFLAIAGAIVVMHGEEIRLFLADTWPRWVRGWFGTA